MARTLAELPKGARLTDYISLGVIAAKFPLAHVHDILRETERTSERQRDLPAHVVIYYVIALGALHAGVLPGGSAMPSGRNSVVARPQRHDQGHGQVGHFSGEKQVGRGAVAATA